MLDEENGGEQIPNDQKTNLTLISSRGFGSPDDVPLFAINMEPLFGEEQGTPIGLDDFCRDKNFIGMEALSSLRLNNRRRAKGVVPC